MPSRPDLRDIASNVRDAFAEMDREALLEILTFVVKEYVVEGPPPMLVHQAETLTDLQGQTFAQVISALQTRFDFPELAMFTVDGDTVSVRVGGVMQPLVAGRQPLQAAEMPRPAAGVRVVETTLQQRPPAQAPPAAAPPPVRGLSMRGAPTATPGSAAPAAPGAPAPANSAAPPAPSDKSGDRPTRSTAEGSAKVDDKPEGTGDDASARFSLLELD